MMHRSGQVLEAGWAGSRPTNTASSLAVHVDLATTFRWLFVSHGLFPVFFHYNSRESEMCSSAEKCTNQIKKETHLQPGLMTSSVVRYANSNFTLSVHS